MSKIIELEICDEDYTVLIEAGNIMGTNAIDAIKNTLIPKYIDSLKEIVGQVNDMGGKEVVERRLKFTVIKGDK